MYVANLQPQDTRGHRIRAQTGPVLKPRGTRCWFSSYVTIDGRNRISKSKKKTYTVEFRVFRLSSIPD